VKKIIRELLSLLWKVFRLVLWKWLKPILGKVFFYGIIIAAIIGIIAFIITR
jgi:hypothetical protein